MGLFSIALRLNNSTHHLFWFTNMHSVEIYPLVFEINQIKLAAGSWSLHSQIKAKTFDLFKASSQIVIRDKDNSIYSICGTETAYFRCMSSICSVSTCF